MKGLTFAFVASMVGLGCVLSLSLSANAESRYEYCQHHDCGEPRGERDHDHDRFFERYHDRYADRHICESHHHSCWYDRGVGAWRFRD